MSKHDIEHRFDFHPATTEEKQSEHTSVRETLKNAALWVDEKVPDGREKALAITKMEEAMFWANAAIARNNPDR